MVESGQYVAMATKTHNGCQSDERTRSRFSGCQGRPGRTRERVRPFNSTWETIEQRFKQNQWHSAQRWGDVTFTLQRIRTRKSQRAVNGQHVVSNLEQSHPLLQEAFISALIIFSSTSLPSLWITLSMCASDHGGKVKSWAMFVCALPDGTELPSKVICHHLPKDSNFDDCAFLFTSLWSKGQDDLPPHQQTHSNSQSGTVKGCC